MLDKGQIQLAPKGLDADQSRAKNCCCLSICESIFKKGKQTNKQANQPVEQQQLGEPGVRTIWGTKMFLHKVTLFKGKGMWY